MLTNKQPNHFNTDHLNADLMGHTIRGGKVTLSAQVLSLFISIGSVMILARLLTPSDFGIIAMVTALTGIVAMFKDAGLSMATVQRDNVNHEQISTLFWINTGLSLVIALLIAVLAPAVAWFFGNEDLKNITMAVALIFFIGGLSVQHQALIRRQMRFGTLAKIQIISAMTGIVLAVAGALNGAGFWALVMQMAASEITSLCLTWLYSGWIPGKPGGGVGIRSMLKFGGYLTGFSFVNYFARNADNILIGKFWGGADLGLYTKAYSLLLLPIQQINKPISEVAMPALSRLQNKPEQFRSFYLSVLKTVSYLTLPIIGWMVVCREEIILILLGDKWVGAVPIFSILALSAFVQPIGNIGGLLFVALGRTKQMMKWGILSSALITLSIIIGLPFGVTGVALAYTVILLIIFVPMIIYTTKMTPVKAMDYYSVLKSPMIISLFCSVMTMIIEKVLNENINLFIKATLMTAVFFSSYVLLVRKFEPVFFCQGKYFLSRKLKK
jgi:PST family polysaccharide transporter